MSEDKRILGPEPDAFSMDKNRQRKLTATIKKPPESRPKYEIEFVLPWVKKKSEVLSNLEDDVLSEIVRSCEHRVVQTNEVIMRQGDYGDTLFIILSGSVSLYINTGDKASTATGSTTSETDASDSTTSDSTGSCESIAGDEEQDGISPEQKQRLKLGHFISKFESGDCFGEIALINETCVRPASVITDQVCNFMVIPRDLYNLTLKSYYNTEYEERTEFVDSHRLFRHWTKKEKRHLVESLQRKVFCFDSPITKQGKPWSGLAFVLEGRAHCHVEPGKHEQQFPQLLPYTELDVIEAETGRQKKIASSTPRVGNENPEQKSVDHVHIKRKEGYAAAEKYQLDKCVHFYTVERGDIVGDIEGIMELPTSVGTTTATTQVTAFILNPKNYERLIAKRGSDDATIQLLRQNVNSKLKTRLLYGSGIPLLRAIYNKMNSLGRERFTRPPVVLRDGKHLPSDDVLFNHLMSKFIKNEAELLIPKVRGGLYYRDLALEKARIRNSVEEHAGEEANALRKMRQVKRIKRAKRPPSLKPRTVKALKKSLSILRDMQQFEEKKAYIQEVRQREEDEIKAAKAQFKKFKRYSMAMVTKNNEPFEPGKLTTAMLQQHDQIMSEKFQKEKKKDGPTTRPSPFITKLKENYTESTPDLSKPERKHVTIRASSAHANKSPGEEAGALPRIHRVHGDDMSRESSRGRSGRSRLLSRELGGGSTVDLDIETGLLPLLSENPAYRDWETNDASLHYLEEKVKAFSMKQHPKVRRASLEQLPPLARYESKDETTEQPKPGGRVLVQSKPCHAANKTRYYMKEHQHTRTSMVPRLPEYDVMRKQRMIRHMILDEERKEWLAKEERGYKSENKHASTLA